MLSHADHQSRLRALDRPDGGRRRRRSRSHQERDRAEHVRRPDVAVGLGGAQVQVERLEGGPVEEQGADELHQAGPPGEPVGGLLELQRRGGREEERADEVRDAVGSGADPLDYGGKAPSAKQAEPTMNRAATHHASARRPPLHARLVTGG